MRNLNVVLCKDGYYWVGVLTSMGLSAFKVTDTLRCACGGTPEAPCTHVEAVKAYLRLEGREGPQAPAELPETCPICGNEVRGEGGHWRCAASPGHYWQWRGEQTGVKAFLTRPHPAKQGAFYEQSIEERDAYLKHIAHGNGYTPYR